jgi:hypothetical protein
MKTYMINPNNRGCIGIVKAKNEQTAITEGINRFGLAECWVQEVRK